MLHGLFTTLQVLIASGVGAGAVTFALNFWKADEVAGRLRDEVFDEMEVRKD